MGVFILAWLNGWQYRKEITYTPSSNYNTAADFVGFIDINDGNFDLTKVKSDGSDLVVTKSDGVTVARYWVRALEEGGFRVYFRAEDVSDGGYLYYGNDSPTISGNPSDVFLFWTDFDSIDWNTWIGMRSEGSTTWTCDLETQFNISNSKINVRPQTYRGCATLRLRDSSLISYNGKDVRFEVQYSSSTNSYYRNHYARVIFFDSAKNGAGYVGNFSKSNHVYKFGFAIYVYDGTETSYSYDNSTYLSDTAQHVQEGWTDKYANVSYIIYRKTGMVKSKSVARIPNMSAASYISPYFGIFDDYGGNGSTAGAWVDWFAIYYYDPNATIGLGNEETSSTGVVEVQELSDSISSVETVKFVVGAYEAEDIGAVGAIGGLPTQSLKSLNSLVDFEKLVLSVVGDANINALDDLSLVQRLVQSITQEFLLSSNEGSNVFETTVDGVSTTEIARLLVSDNNRVVFSLLDSDDEEVVADLLSNFGILARNNVSIVINNVDLIQLLDKILFVVLSKSSSDISLADVADIGGAIVELVSIASKMALSSISSGGVKTRLKSLVLVNATIRSILSSNINDRLSLLILLHLITKLSSGLADIIRAVEMSKATIAINNVDDIRTLAMAVVNVYSALLSKLPLDEEIRASMTSILKHFEDILLIDSVDYGEFVKILYSVYFATEVLRVYVAKMLLMQDGKFTTAVLRQYVAPTDILVRFVANTETLRKYVVGGVRWRKG